MHQYPANKFSEGSIAAPSAYLNLDFMQAGQKNLIDGFYN
jgi:hypothetical protein